jgi:hypothetical protein
MTKELFLGNAILGLGLIESGCHIVKSYPNTKSSDSLPAVVKFKKKLGMNIYT